MPCLTHRILLENKCTQLLVAQILLLLVPTMVHDAIPAILIVPTPTQSCANVDVPYHC